MTAHTELMHVPTGRCDYRNNCKYNAFVFLLMYVNYAYKHTHAHKRLIYNGWQIENFFLFLLHQLFITIALFFLFV